MTKSIKAEPADEATEREIKALMDGLANEIDAPMPGRSTFDLMMAEQGEATEVMEHLISGVRKELGDLLAEEDEEGPQPPEDEAERDQLQETEHLTPLDLLTAALSQHKAIDHILIAVIDKNGGITVNTTSHGVVTLATLSTVVRLATDAMISRG